MKICTALFTCTPPAVPSYLKLGMKYRKAWSLTLRWLWEVTTVEQPLASVEDVEDLRADLQAEPELIKALLLEATDLMTAELRRPVPDPVPGWLRRMCARVACRAVLQHSSPGAHFGVESVGNTAGPFSQNFRFSPGANDGGVWLTAAERRRLRGFGGAFSYQMW